METFYTPGRPAECPKCVCRKESFTWQGGTLVCLDCAITAQAAADALIASGPAELLEDGR